jgi:hypothetical protein
MKTVTLLACLLALTLGASAQASQTVSPIAVPPIAKKQPPNSTVPPIVKK